MTADPIDEPGYPPELAEMVVKAIKDAVAHSGGPNGQLAYRPDEAAAIIRVGRGPFFELLAQGKIPARKLGSRTLILHTDLVAYLESLPTWGETS